MDVTLVEEDEDRRSKSCQLDGRSKRARESTEGTLVGKRSSRTRSRRQQDFSECRSSEVQESGVQETKKRESGVQE